MARTKNAALLLKEQPTANTWPVGAEGALDPAVDGLLVEPVDMDFDAQMLNTDEVNGSLDSEGPIAGGMKKLLTFKAYLKGSGEPGKESQLDLLLRAAGWSKTVTRTKLAASTVVAIANGGLRVTWTGSVAALDAITVGTPFWIKTPTQSAELIATVVAANQIDVAWLTGSLVNEAAGGATDVVYGVPGALAASGTVGQFVAGAAWSNVAQAYRGMVACLSANPATPTMVGIRDYSAARLALIDRIMGAALSNATRAAIFANVLYRPHSGDMPMMAGEYYLDGRRYRFQGARADIEFAFTSGGLAEMNVRLYGQYKGHADVAMVQPTYDATRPGVFRDSDMLIDGQAAALTKLNLAMGNSLEHPDNPNALEGFDPAEIVEREMRLQLDPYSTGFATRDLLSRLRAGGRGYAAARVKGNAAALPGQRVGFVFPQVQPVRFKPTDDRGFQKDSTEFYPAGRDAGAFLCIW